MNKMKVRIANISFNPGNPGPQGNNWADCYTVTFHNLDSNTNPSFGINPSIVVSDLGDLKPGLVGELQFVVKEGE